MHLSQYRHYLLALLLGISACSSKEAPSTLLDNTRQRALNYEVWLPEQPGERPLILFSHGSGGDYRNYLWFIESLVQHGYIVAALNHPGDTALDSSEEGILRVWDRPQDMRFLLENLLKDSRWQARIDKKRIGAAGHSSGGYTALSMAGARFIPERMGAYCTSEARGPDCDLVSGNAVVDYANASDSYRDDRVHAVFAMAPAVGAGIESTSLNAINLPVMITSTLDDELLLFEKNAQYYAREIPGAELKSIPQGGHFLFIECSFVVSIADLFIDQIRSVRKSAQRRQSSDQAECRG